MGRRALVGSVGRCRLGAAAIGSGRDSEAWMKVARQNVDVFGNPEAQGRKTKRATMKGTRGLRSAAESGFQVGLKLGARCSRNQGSRRGERGEGRGARGKNRLDDVLDEIGEVACIHQSMGIREAQSMVNGQWPRVQW